MEATDWGIYEEENKIKKFIQDGIDDMSKLRADCVDEKKCSYKYSHNIAIGDCIEILDKMRGDL